MHFLRFLVVFGLLGLAGLNAETSPHYGKFIDQAEAEAPGEVQLHIIQTYGRLSNFIVKVREVERVAGWQQVRATGDAAFAAWDSLRKDYVWHGGKFEVLYDIVDAKKLKLNEVTFDGTTTRATP
jgi:hypothetical protein